jgi:hypothetical protein
MIAPDQTGGHPQILSPIILAVGRTHGGHGPYVHYHTAVAVGLTGRVHKTAGSRSVFMKIGKVGWSKIGGLKFRMN